MQLECRVLEKFNISLGCFYFPGTGAPQKTLRGIFTAKKLIKSQVDEAQKTVWNFMKDLTKGSMFSKLPLGSLSIPRDKIVLNQEICTCIGKSIDCNCCAAVEGSQGKSLL